MKKLLLVLAMVVTTGALFTSCRSTHSCPAYGKVHQAPVEQPC